MVGHLPNLDLLVPKTPGKIDPWVWGTVTNLSPLSVHIDNDTPSAEIAAVNPGGAYIPVGTRVWCQLRGRKEAKRAIILGNIVKVDNIKTTTFTANGTFTRDAKTLFAHVTMCGGGGSGGQAAATGSGQRSASTGGSGACTAYGKFTKAQLGTSQSVIVGLGGVQGDGGDTSLGSLMSAVGGLVGGNRGPSSGNWAGTTNTPQGGNTATGEYLRVRGGRGAGAKGIAGVWAEGGDGGDTPLGHGGRGNATSAGDGAVGYGAGGGGVANGENSSAAWGGNGAVGIIIITEYLGETS